MALEDLEQAGVLLPREQWGKHPLHTTMNKPWLIGLGMLAMFSSVLMYWGDGHFSTWIGVGLFFMVLFGFTRLSLQAIKKQSPTSKSRP